MKQGDGISVRLFPIVGCLSNLEHELYLYGSCSAEGCQRRKNSDLSVNVGFMNISRGCRLVLHSGCEICADFLSRRRS